MADNTQDLSKRLFNEEQAELIYEQSEAVLHYLGQRIDVLHGQEIRKRLHLTEEEIVFTEAAQRRVLRKLKAAEKAQRKAAAPTWQKAAKQILRTCAMVLLAVLVLNTVLVVTVEAYREKVFELFTIETDKATQLFWKEGRQEFLLTEQEKINIEQKLKTAEFWYPEYVPEGYALQSAFKVKNRKFIVFSAQGKTDIFFVQGPAEGVSYSIDNENGTHYEIKLRGRIAKCFELKDQQNQLIWQENGTIFDLTGALTKEELVQIANSIVLKK